jgi:hypothetical protein
MNARMKALLVSTSSAIAVAILAFSLALGGARAVRADDAEALPEARVEIVLVSAKTLEAMEQRISHLEEIVTSMAAAAQQVSPRRLCVADDSGAETCLTKPQLDALLAIQAHAMEEAQPATLAAAEARTPPEEQAAAKAENKPEPPAPDSQIEPEPTGSIATATAKAAEPSFPTRSEGDAGDDLP